MAGVQKLAGRALMPLFLISILVFGCGPDRPPLGDVSGTVTYDGKLLEQGTIIFEVPGSRPTCGKIVNGQITELCTFVSGDGVPVGEARVAITATVARSPSTPTQAAASSNEPTPTAGMVEFEQLIPVKYGNPETSGLTATIEKGRNSLSFDLSSE